MSGPLGVAGSKPALNGQVWNLPLRWPRERHRCAHGQVRLPPPLTGSPPRLSLPDLTGLPLTWGQASTEPAVVAPVRRVVVDPAGGPIAAGKVDVPAAAANHAVRAR